MRLKCLRISVNLRPSCPRRNLSQENARGHPSTRLLQASCYLTTETILFTLVLELVTRPETSSAVETCTANPEDTERRAKNTSRKSPRCASYRNTSYSSLGRSSHQMDILFAPGPSRIPCYACFINISPSRCSYFSRCNAIYLQPRVQTQRIECRNGFCRTHLSNCFDTARTSSSDTRPADFDILQPRQTRRRPYIRKPRPSRKRYNHWVVAVSSDTTVHFQVTSTKAHKKPSGSSKKHRNADVHAGKLDGSEEEKRNSPGSIRHCDTPTGTFSPTREAPSSPIHVTSSFVLPNPFIYHRPRATRIHSSHQVDTCGNLFKQL